MFVAYFAMGYIVLSVSITIVSILLPWCASVGSGVFDGICSISLVKSLQFAFL